MKSLPPVSNAKKLKVEHMKRVRAAYVQAKKDGTMQTRQVVATVQLNKLA